MPEAPSHILLVPSSSMKLRLLCDADPKKLKNDTLVSTDSPGAATCTECKARLEVLTAPLRKQLARIAEGSDEALEKYYAWAHGPDSGTSSKAMVQAITGARLVAESERARTPSDPDDFGRCSRVLERFPELRAQLQKAAALSPGWAALVAAWDELEQLYARELEEIREHGKDICAWRHANGEDPYRTYNRMAELLGKRPMAYTPPEKRGGRRAR